MTNEQVEKQRQSINEAKRLAVESRKEAERQEKQRQADAAKKTAGETKKHL